jgi:hypothetical protein
MRCLSSHLRNSLFALLGNSPTQAMLESGTEDIREAMLALVDESAARNFPHVLRRIRYARDIQALWYLRGDLVAVLAARHGEIAAQERVQRITRMFRGLVPGSLQSRPSRLA